MTSTHIPTALSISLTLLHSWHQEQHKQLRKELLEERKDRKYGSHVKDPSKQALLCKSRKFTSFILIVKRQNKRVVVQRAGVTYVYFDRSHLQLISNEKMVKSDRGNAAGDSSRENSCSHIVKLPVIQIFKGDILSRYFSVNLNAQIFLYFLHNGNKISEIQNV